MPYVDSYDPNQLDTGLPTNFTATIDALGFVFDPDVNNGQDCFLHVSLVDIDDPDVDEPQRLYLKTGKGWEPVDEGLSVERADGKVRNFHQNSYIGLILGSLVESGVDLKDVCKQKDAMPSEMAFWHNMKCHWDRKTINYGGEIGNIDRLLPTELIDAGASTPPVNPTKADLLAERSTVEREAERAKIKASAKAPTAKAATKKVAAVEAAEPEVLATSVSGVVLDQDVYDSLFDLAYEAPDNETFQNLALGQYSENDEAMVAIIDTDADSIWERAVAKYSADQEG